MPSPEWHARYPDAIQCCICHEWVPLPTSEAQGMCYDCKHAGRTPASMNRDKGAYSDSKYHGSRNNGEW